MRRERARAVAARVIAPAPAADDRPAASNQASALQPMQGRVDGAGRQINLTARVRLIYRAIAVVFITAVILGAMRWREDCRLGIIGEVAFGAASAGYLHCRQHRSGDTQQASQRRKGTDFLFETGPLTLVPGAGFEPATSGL